MSKGLEALNDIKKDYTINGHMDIMDEYRFTIIKKELKIKDILINKEVNIHHLNWCIEQCKGDYEKFKSLYCVPTTPVKDYSITKDEFKLFVNTFIDNTCDKKVQVNSHGTNKAIKYKLLDDKKMRELGFTDHRRGYWYYCKVVDKGPDCGYDLSTTFNITIPKKGVKDELTIDILDESYLQPYDYQAVLKENPDNPFAKKIERAVIKEMIRLVDAGIILDYRPGDYI